jgi:hypothetical protein
MYSWRPTLNKTLSLKELWAELMECYKNVDVRCLALRDGGNWRNLMIVALASMKGKDDIKKEAEKDFSLLKELGVNEIRELGIFNDVLSKDDFLSFIDEMEKGRVTLNHQSIFLREGYGAWYIIEAPRVFRRGELADWPSVEYDLSGSPIEIPRDLDEKLESLGLLGGIDEVATIWLRVSTVRNYALNAMIVLPIYFKLEAFEASNNGLSLSFKVHRSLAPKLEVLLALREKCENAFRAIENKLIKFNEFQSSLTDSEFLRCEVRHKFKAFLNLKDEVYFCVRSGKLGLLHKDRVFFEDLLRRAEFKDPFINLLTKFISMDKIEKILQSEELLLEKKDASANFERLACYLLSLLGMRVIEMGDTRFRVVKEENGSSLGDIDIVAQDPRDGRLHVVQCTTGATVMDKISVLANVSDRLRRKGLQVEPLLMVKVRVAPEVKRNELRIRVVDREDLVRVIRALSVENIDEAKRILLGS